MYKQTDVFLNAEDSAKIAPFIPKEMLEGWEWWYQVYWLNDDKAPRYEFKNVQDLEEGSRIVPALDVGILGAILCRHSHIIFDAPFCAGTELQNRRDALMYLIDQKLIGPVEGREEL